MTEIACVFCEIAAGDLPAQVVLADDDFVAFLDARPVFKGHVLLVPRQHLVTLADLPAGLRDGFLERVQWLPDPAGPRPRGRGGCLARRKTASPQGARPPC